MDLSFLKKIFLATIIIFFIFFNKNTFAEKIYLTKPNLIKNDSKYMNTIFVICDPFGGAFNFRSMQFIGTNYSNFSDLKGPIKEFNDNKIIFYKTEEKKQVQEFFWTGSSYQFSENGKVLTSKCKTWIQTPPTKQETEKRKKERKEELLKAQQDIKKRQKKIEEEKEKKKKYYEFPPSKNMLLKPSELHMSKNGKIEVSCKSEQFAKIEGIFDKNTNRFTRSVSLTQRAVEQLRKKGINRTTETKTISSPIKFWNRNMIVFWATDELKFTQEFEWNFNSRLQGYQFKSNGAFITEMCSTYDYR